MVKITISFHIFMNGQMELEGKEHLPQLLLNVSFLLIDIKIGGKSILTYTGAYLLGYFVFSKKITITKIARLKFVYLNIFIISSYLDIFLYLYHGILPILNHICFILSGVSGILVALSFVSLYWNKTNKINTYFKNISFLFYIFHFPVCIVMQYLFSLIISNSYINYILSLIASYVITFGICEIIRNTPGVRNIFGIKTKKS